MDKNNKIEQLRNMYPEGTKIKLNYMNDNYNPVPSGTLGIVEHVDDAGQIHVKWENGSSLALIYDEDDFEIINEKTIAQMKDGVILVNTSRGGLIKTEDLISGIRDHKFFAVGLDVYEEESDYVFEDLSESIMQTSLIQRLLSFPNVTMTSHQGFFTEEALTNIAETTMENAQAYINGDELKNEVFS